MIICTILEKKSHLGKIFNLTLSLLFLWLYAFQAANKQKQPIYKAQNEEGFQHEKQICTIDVVRFVLYNCLEMLAVGKGNRGVIGPLNSSSRYETSILSLKSMLRG